MPTAVSKKLISVFLYVFLVVFSLQGCCKMLWSIKSGYSSSTSGVTWHQSFILQQNVNFVPSQHLCRFFAGLSNSHTPVRPPSTSSTGSRGRWVCSVNTAVLKNQMWRIKKWIGTGSGGLWYNRDPVLEEFLHEELGVGLFVWLVCFFPSLWFSAVL